MHSGHPEEHTHLLYFFQYSGLQVIVHPEHVILPEPLDNSSNINELSNNFNKVAVLIVAVLLAPNK